MYLIQQWKGGNGMSYRKEFNLIMERMHLSENTEKYNDLNICPSNLKGIKKELYDSVVSFDTLTGDLENGKTDKISYQSTLNKWKKIKAEIIRLLDENGWQ